MSMTATIKRLGLALLFTSLSTGLVRGEFDHSHATFDGVLKQHVKNEKVDYAALQKNPAALNTYLDTLAAVPESSYKSWEKDQQMAYLINLYNAATLKLVIDHYPVNSIRDIAKSKGGPWKQKVVRLFGNNQNLDYIEHVLLRPKFKDPRVHFAVNCASIGCPALRAGAFQADKLSSQLDEQGRVFLRDTSKNRLDVKSKTLHLSAIFDWFKADFTGKSGSVEKFVAPYLSESDAKIVLGGGLKMSSIDYDWSLNKQ